MAMVTSESSACSRSVRLTWAAAACRSPVSWATDRTVKRASPVSAAARAPCPATSPITVSHPAGVAKAS